MTDFTDIELEAAQNAILKGRVPYVGLQAENDRIRVARLIWHELNGTPLEDRFTAADTNNWRELTTDELKHLFALVDHTRRTLALDTQNALAMSEYGGVYQLLVDGSVVAEFVPGVTWSTAYEALSAAMGDAVSYRWKSVRP